jgi:hypothetical protein
MAPLGFPDRRPTRSRGTRDPVLERTGLWPASCPRVVDIGDFERWIKTRCDVKGCWDTAVTTCIECDARLCREHVCYDGTLPYCRRCLYWDDDAVELIEVGEWR